jgi:hypothetical protein
MSTKRQRKRRLPRPVHPLDFARASFPPGDPHRSDDAIISGYVPLEIDKLPSLPPYAAVL